MPSLEKAKSFAGNIAAIIATNIVRAWFNNKLRKITPDELYKAIQDNTDLWDVTPESIKQSGSGYKGSYGKLFREYESEINTELILDWMKNDHIGLYGLLINTPNGIEWIDHQVRKIKEQIIQM